MIKIEPPIRGTDKHGSGAFGASRGSRTHNGVDLACYKDSIIGSPCEGVVTKRGFPYSQDDQRKHHLRYVEITDKYDRKHRVFYAFPSVEAGDLVFVGMDIGVSQGLADIYPGITDHIHYEIIEDGEYINPEGVSV